MACLGLKVKGGQDYYLSKKTRRTRFEHLTSTAETIHLTTKQHLSIIKITPYFSFI